MVENSQTNNCSHPIEDVLNALERATNELLLLYKKEEQALIDGQNNGLLPLAQEKKQFLTTIQTLLQKKVTVVKEYFADGTVSEFQKNQTEALLQETVDPSVIKKSSFLPTSWSKPRYPDNKHERRATTFQVDNYGSNELLINFKKPELMSLSQLLSFLDEPLASNLAAIHKKLLNNLAELFVISHRNATLLRHAHYYNDCLLQLLVHQLGKSNPNLEKQFYDSTGKNRVIYGD